MITYWLLLIGLTLGGYFICRLKHGRLIYCIAAGIALFTVSAVRAHVGYDYNLYGTVFMNNMTRSMENIIAEERMEKGFAIPMKLLSDVTSDYQVMFVIIAFIITLAVMLYIYFYSEKPYLSVFFFLTFGLFFNSMDFMRQMIAASVILYALQFVKKKQFIRFLSLVLFASVFHISALIMIPFYFILRIKMDWLTLGIYSGVTVIYFIFSWDILGFVTKYVYKGYDPTKSPEVINGTNPIYALFFAAFFMLAFLLRKELTEKDSFNNILLNCMFFMVFFEICGIRHAIVSRFAVLFFIPPVVILMPRVFDVLMKKCSKAFGGDKTRTNILKTVSVVVVMGLCSFIYTYMIANNYNGISPYKTIFEEEVDRNGGAD